MKPALECQNISEIRNAIDSLDRQMVELIGERATYVRAAASFKQNTTEVKAEDRVSSMLQKRRDWAVQNNLNPDAIEQLYRDLIDYFINEELEQWQQP